MNRYIISREDLQKLIEDKNAEVELGKTNSYQEDATLVTEDKGGDLR